MSNTLNDMLHMYAERPNDMSLLQELIFDGIPKMYDAIESIWDTPKEMKRYLEQPSELARSMAFHAYLVITRRSSEDPIRKLRNISEMLGVLYDVRKESPHIAKTVVDDMNIKHAIDIINMPDKYIIAEESIVTACAPIVPYVGVLRKSGCDGQTVDTSNHDVPSPPDVDIQHIAAETVASANIEAELKSLRASLLASPLYMSDCMAASESIKRLVKSSESQIRDMIQYAARSRPAIQKIIGIGYLIRVHQSQDRVQKFDIVTNPMKYDFKTVMEAFTDLAFEENPIVEQEEPADVDDIPSSFDLDHLMQYFFTTRRFRTNDYTNNKVARAPYVKSMTYYHDLMVLEPDNQTDTIKYVYVPVIDDLDRSIVKVIKYWTDRRIEILTEDQFRVDIAPVPAETT